MFKIKKLTPLLLFSFFLLAFFSFSFSQNFYTNDKPDLLKINSGNLSAEGSLNFSLAFSGPYPNCILIGGKLSCLPKVSYSLNNGSSYSSADSGYFSKSYSLKNLSTTINSIFVKITNGCGSAYDFSKFDSSKFGTSDCLFSLPISLASTDAEGEDPENENPEGEEGPDGSNIRPGSGCVITGWFPLNDVSGSNICSTETYTEVSNCLDIREVSGSKDCSIENVEIPPSGETPQVTPDDPNFSELECSLDQKNWKSCNDVVSMLVQSPLYVRYDDTNNRNVDVVEDSIILSPGISASYTDFPAGKFDFNFRGNTEIFNLRFYYNTSLEEIIRIKLINPIIREI